jgi:ABC-type xylose transport system substrate-binding protein
MIELRGVNGALRERVLAIQFAKASKANRELQAAVEAMVNQNAEVLVLTAAAAGKLTTELKAAQRAERVAAKLVN